MLCVAGGVATLRAPRAAGEATVEVCHAGVCVCVCLCVHASCALPCAQSFHNTRLPCSPACTCPPTPTQVGFFLLRYAHHFKAHLAELTQLLDEGKLQVGGVWGGLWVCCLE